MNWKIIVTILLFVVLGFCCNGCDVNPISGESRMNFISPEEEVEIGSKYAPEIEKEMGGRINDPQLQSYIDSVGQRIAAVSHKPNIKFSFAAVVDEQTNAFALPGGYVFITKGMLSKLSTEAQLAGILGHEITHVVASHSAVSMSREIGISVLLSAASATMNTPAGAETVANLTTQIIGMSYSRKDEVEADKTGMDYMYKAGYDPYGMIETMEILQSLNSGGQIEFFSTHPIPEHRREYLLEKISSDYPNLANLKKGGSEYETSVLKKLK
ncbi:MAG TPA: M48 family metallopeptidase [Sedimentisphaerales bacterium]|nr:M48 family metallopeptidase [Sedimentisphaerales bacterium]